MAVPRCTRENKWVLIRWIYCYILWDTVVNAQPCLFKIRVHCLLNHFRVFSYVSRSIHNGGHASGDKAWDYLSA
jgi:hypothetical protein